MPAKLRNTSINDLISKHFAVVFKSLHLRPYFAQFIASDKKSKLLTVLVITVAAGAFITLAYALSTNKQLATNSRSQRLDSKLTDQQEENGQTNPNTSAPVVSSTQTDESANGASASESANASSSSASNSTTVTVNGQPVDIPSNGSYNQTIENPGGGSTTVSGNNSQTISSSGGSVSNQSSTTVDVNSKGN